MSDAALRDLLAAEAIRELLGAYLEAADRGRSQALAELFTPDGVLEVSGSSFDAGTHAGRAAILHRLDRSRADLAVRSDAPLLRHHVSSVRIAIGETGAIARVDSYFLAVTDGGPDHWGRYRDQVVRTDDGWRFAHRTVVHEGSHPGSWLRRQR